MQYRTISNVKFNGQTFAPGELVDFSGEQAEEMLAAGAIETAHRPFNGGVLNLTIKPETDEKAS